MTRRQLVRFKKKKCRLRSAKWFRPGSPSGCWCFHRSGFGGKTRGQCGRKLQSAGHPKCVRACVRALERRVPQRKKSCPHLFLGAAAAGWGRGGCAGCCCCCLRVLQESSACTSGSLLCSIASTEAAGLAAVSLRVPPLPCGAPTPSDQPPAAGRTSSLGGPRPLFDPAHR